MTPGVRRAVGGGSALGAALLLAWLSRAPMALSVPNSLIRSSTEAYSVWATITRPTSKPS
mgnify:CR=1 FL=1